MAQILPVYDIILNDDADVSELASLTETAQKQGGTVVGTNFLTKSITVSFPSSASASHVFIPLLSNPTNYTVEKISEVEATSFLGGLLDITVGSVVGASRTLTNATALAGNIALGATLDAGKIAIGGR